MNGYLGVFQRRATDLTAARQADLRLHTDGLVVGYAGHPIVTNINLTLRAGQALALVGTNGSGKSTLLKTLVGLQAALGGTIAVLGTRPGGAPRRLGYLSQFHQSGFVLPLRAIDVVRMARFPERGLLGRLTADDHELVQQAMRTMGVERFAESPLRALSGGQQQRVYLAQVLARQADLLVLDEPTASLDAAGRETYTRAMQAELARGATVITATHDMQEAANCDLVLLLAQRVIAFGSPKQVLTPEALLETFGVVLTNSPGAPSFAVVERECGHH